MRNLFVVTSIVLLAAVGVIYLYWPPILWTLLIIVPLISVGISDMLQVKHTLRRNFPVAGWGRYFLEDLRPKIYQYFIESETEASPISRMYRSIVYQRAKKELSTTPFGTKVDVYADGYEWANHSISPIDHTSLNDSPRVLVGGPDCKQPYNASILNVSAMSFGALSYRAILSLNGGAKLGGFAHNTGEGSISPYHEEPGGDLIWQVGTGYFGCRNSDGSFNDELFKEKAIRPNVKMEVFFRL
jgi:glutamate synthase domain-containing protein 2